MNRREFLRGLIVSSVLIGIGGVGLGEMYRIARQTQQQTQINQPTTQSTVTTSSGQVQQQVTAGSSSSAPAGYVFITQASALSGRSYAYFNHPNFGSSILVNYNGQWKAFSAICTHVTCNLQYRSSTIYCPCHGGTFSPTNGSVTGGPPPRPIAEYGVQITGGGVYVGTSRIN